MMFPIATLADWFGVGVIEGIKESERCGASGVQVYAWDELNPMEVSPQKIRQVLAVARACAQNITALCGEVGGHGLEIATDNTVKLEYLKRTVDMALALDCTVVTTHIGIIPENKDCDTYKSLHEACSQIAEYADKKGAVIAVETGPEPVARLRAFVDLCGKGIGINYDPANLVMVTKDDEVQGVYTAGSKIVHTHAKDGRCNQYVGPEKIYSIFADGGIEALSSVDTYLKETPLGEGEVRWPLYLKALKDIGYTGYLTIEREVGQKAGEDIRKAVTFLQQAMKDL